MKLSILENNKAIVVVDETNKIIFTANGLNQEDIDEIIFKVNNYDEVFERYKDCIDEFESEGYNCSGIYTDLNRLMF